MLSPLRTMATTLRVAVFVLLARFATGSSTNFWSYYCVGENYASNDSYIANLNLLSRILPWKVSSAPTLFARVMTNSEEEYMYAVGQCRGDTNNTTCNRCITQALQDVQLICASKIQAVIYYDLCSLQISSEQLQFKIDDDDSNKILIISDPSFANIQHELDNDVKSFTIAMESKAAILLTRFATGWETLIGEGYNYSIYGLAQCLPELTQLDCQHCLEYIATSTTLPRTLLGRRSMIWCNYRYELYTFFSGYPMLIMSIDKSTYKTKGTIVAIVVPSIVVTIIVIGLLLFFWRKRNLRIKGTKFPGVELTGSKKIATGVELIGSKKASGSFSIPGVKEDACKAECPSALALFDDIKSSAQGKKIALFLDYDGTLSPMVNNPDMAFMSHEMRAAVRDAAKLFPTVIVTGRSRDKVFEFVQLRELYYAGSHGMDIMASRADSEGCSEISEEVNLFQPAGEFMPVINQACKSLSEAIQNIKGAPIEDNKFCVSVHYRNVDEKNWGLVEAVVNDVLETLPSLKMTRGKMVLEIRPVIDWDKGKAIEYLLETLGLNNSIVLPIYIGDDKTDEDAFKVLRESNNGFGILVSQVPKETAANYTLSDPSEVMEFLKCLVGWKAQSP